MWDRIKAEPVMVSALVAALIALVTAFGLDLTVDQVAGIMGVILPVMALFVRGQVTPTSSLVSGDE